jgi:KDO2-lipid IV(A) lauroyltransferase
MLRALMRVAGFSGARSLGAFFGELEFRLAWRQRSQLVRDMATALGRDAADPAVTRDLLQAYRVSDAAVLEVLAMMDRPHDQAMLAQHCEVAGLDHLREALAGGRGVILLAAHMGNSALVPVRLAQMGFRISVVSRKARMMPEEFFVNGFKSYGVESIMANDGIQAYRSIVAALRAGGIVFLMLDQGARSINDGIIVRFLGKDVPMPVGPAHLAKGSKAAVLPVTTTAAEPVWRFVIEPPVASLHESGFENGTRTLVGIVERQIREYPQFWTWHQRRWRKYPLASGGP